MKHCKNVELVGMPKTDFFPSKNQRLTKISIFYELKTSAAVNVS
jgi:hypothetical protein